MLIANPIYDVVFKYLLDDNKIARIIISAIINEEIESLEYKPLEHRVQIDKGAGFTVYHIDFAATIKTKEGEHKQVIIEIQKAKFSSDIMRFRKYLGFQYMDENNYVKEPDVAYGKKKALPIISIYFLGYSLNQIEAPVIAVKRKYYDVSQNTEINIKDEFIESLTHDSFVIQIPYLKKRRRNDLEILLSIFDQGNILYDHHIINVNDEDFPERYRPIIRRLQKAHAEKEVRDSMDTEDFYLRDMEDYEREIAERDGTIEEMDKAIAKRDMAIQEKDKAIEDKDKAIEDKDKMITDLKNRLRNNQ